MEIPEFEAGLVEHLDWLVARGYVLTLTTIRGRLGYVIAHDDGYGVIDMGADNGRVWATLIGAISRARDLAERHERGEE